MRHIFRRIALVILLFAMIMSSTACKKALYVSGNTGTGFRVDRLQAMVKTNKIICDISDVSFDFSYGFYWLKNTSLEQEKDLAFNKCFHYAIYLSSNEELIFEEDENENIVDYENGVNAMLYKYFTYEEAFETNYGFYLEGIINTMRYNHCEKLTIPEEFFVSSSECVYIHVVMLSLDELNQSVARVFENTTVAINYKLLGEDKVILLND